MNAASEPAVQAELLTRQRILGQRGGRAQGFLLACGILASLLYAAMLVFVPMQWAGYSSASQTVSELSAIGAPTRSLWVALGIVWTLFYAAFGWGVWGSAGGNRHLRVVGGVIVVAAVFGLFWPPMHQREVLAAGGGTLTDTLHIVWTAMNGLLTLLAMGFGAAALGMRFRVYSIATMVILAAAGILTSREAPGVSANLPTPWIGVWERINIGVWLLWVVVLAIALLRARVAGPQAGDGGRQDADEVGQIAGHAAVQRRDSVTDLRGFIGRHPVLTYFALTFAISWGGILIVAGPGGFLGTEEISQVLYPVAVLATLAGPSVAGILLTGLIDGRAGLREFGSRLLRWRVGARWYAVALLSAPLLTTAVLLALSTTSSEFLPLIFTTDDKATLLLSGIVGGLVVGIFEELGWTGFAVPRLRRHHSALGTGLIVGLLWGAWHFPVFSGNNASSGALPLAMVLPVLLFAWLPAFRVLMVWVYDHTGSLLVAVLMHASLTASTLILGPALSGVALLTNVLVWAAVLWVVVGAVALVHGGHLSRPPLRARVA